MDYVILVDKQDNEIGKEEKMKAHEDAKLHRAFSIFVFNKKGELMLHQRALSKYHCGGLWTNTCCSHPRPGEKTEDAAHRRLVEEMGFDCPLKEIFKFHYKAEFSNNLTEHEIDHVFIGNYDKDPKINPEEVESFKWIGIEELQKDIKENPDKYTPWFRIAMERTAEFAK